jgi:putative ABC transport system permease protein
MPLDPSSWTARLYVEGRPLPAPGQEPSTDVFSVSPDYFRTLGIGVLRGRVFSPEEGRQAAKVAIINRTLAQQHWPGADPVGQRLCFGSLERPDPWLTVVGVVADIRLHSLDEPPKPALYLPANGGAGLVIRTETSPLSMVAAVRKQVRELDKDQPLYDCKSLEQCMAEAVVDKRATAWLLGSFAAIALVLASVGIYGLVSYSVAQRTHEIGVRMALGAQRRQLTRHVVGGGLKLVLVGLAAGLLTACGLTRFLTSLLYGVRPIDPATFAAVSGVLLAVALLACWLPARRAARVDPMVALRHG